LSYAGRGGATLGSYSRPIDFEYHSTLGLTVIKKKKSTTLGSETLSVALELKGNMFMGFKELYLNLFLASDFERVWPRTLKKILASDLKKGLKPVESGQAEGGRVGR